MIRSGPGLVIAALGLALGLLPTCAGGSARRAEAPPAAEVRLKDSAPERAAALRAADRSLRLEEDEERWGIEQAKERERREAAARARQSGTGGGGAGGRGGVVPCSGPRC
jgi:hypothetical protein